jgi:uncharacterized OB-fold protein
MEVPIKEGVFHKPESPSEKPYLIGSRCRLCGYVCFPKKQVCVKCVRDDCMAETKFGPYAHLDSYAVIHVAPPGFTVPYIQAYVILEQGPKIFTLISGCEPRDDALAPGQKMELVIERITDDENGNHLIGWKFKPAEEKDRS